MTTKNDIFEQFLICTAETVTAGNETQRSHGWIKSESKKEVENIQNNDAVSPEPKSDNNYERKEEVNKLTEEKPEINKKKAFKLFAGLMKDAEGGDEDDQHKEESSSDATVAYQPAVANNLFGNTGVTNQITFSPASDFRTVEERISELFTRLMMETDRDKILYIVNQIINLVPDKEAFKKTLFSKLKGM